MFDVKAEKIYFNAKVFDIGFRDLLPEWCQTFTLKIERRVKEFVFKKYRFFEWESKDEEFCRKYGGGEDVWKTIVVEIPRCFIYSEEYFPTQSQIIGYEAVIIRG